MIMACLVFWWKNYRSAICDFCNNIGPIADIDRGFVNISVSVRQPTFNSGFDEIGCEEGERDHHLDLPYAAAFSRRDCFCIC